MAITYVEFSSIGADLGGCFRDTNEINPIRHNEAINGPDGHVWK